MYRPNLAEPRVVVLATALAATALAATAPAATAHGHGARAHDARSTPAAPVARAPVHRLTLERIVVSGNQRVATYVIRRHLHLARGDEITADVIRAARLRLLATGYFRRVSLTTRRGSTTGSVVLRITVSERGNPSVETGFGYQDINGWFLTLIGLRIHNALGDDSHLRFGLRLGFRIAGADAEWTKPITRSARYSLAARLYAYTADQIFYTSDPQTSSGGPGAGFATGASPATGFRQKIERGGTEIVLGVRTGAHSRIEAGVGSVTIRPKNTFSRVNNHDETFPAGSLPGALRARNNETTISGPVFRAFRDTRNSRVYPTGGSFARVLVNINSTAFGGEEVFSRVRADARKHLHLGRGWVSSSRIAAGITSNNTPYYERFYIGGNYSVRGFPEWSLSAAGGDDVFWTANEEIRWPVAGRVRHPRVVALAFIDTGSNWQHSGASRAKVYTSAGWGLRFILPWVGTLGLDAGIPLVKSPTDDPYRVHLSLGFAY